MITLITGTGMRLHNHDVAIINTYWVVLKITCFCRFNRIVIKMTRLRGFLCGESIAHIAKAWNGLCIEAKTWIWISEGIFDTIPPPIDRAAHRKTVVAPVFMKNIFVFDENLVQSWLNFCKFRSFVIKLWTRFPQKRSICFSRKLGYYRFSMRSIDWRWNNFSKIPSGIQIQIFVSIHRPFHVSILDLVHLFFHVTP